MEGSEIIKKKLKVVIFVEEFSPISETFVYDHVMMLSKVYETHVICLNHTNKEVRPFESVHVINYEESIIKRIQKRIKTKIGIKSNYYNKNLSIELIKIISRIQPNIIHCHFGPAGLLFSKNIKNIPFPIFITFHGYDASSMLSDNSYVKQLKILSKKKNIYFLFVSNYLLENISRLKIFPVNKHILHLGIDTDYFKRKNYKLEKTFCFLQVSRFVDKKGHKYTLEAYSSFLNANPGFKSKLVLAGDGPIKDSIINYAKALGIYEYIVFPGAVNKDSVRLLLDNANVFVHHSVTSENGNTEGIPVVIMEAMSMELPIISTFHSGIPELIEHNINGFLVKEKDIETYANKMNKSIKTGYLPENRAKIITQFSKKRLLNDIINLYHLSLSDNN